MGPPIGSVRDGRVATPSSSNIQEASHLSAEQRPVGRPKGVAFFANSEPEAEAQDAGLSRCDATEARLPKDRNDRRRASYMRDPSEQNSAGDLSHTEANRRTATTGDSVEASSLSDNREVLNGSPARSVAPEAPRRANFRLRSGGIVALAAFGLALRLWLIFGWRFLEEDALITLRYAKNLWTGAGLVYNTNERVMGFTSPLWTFLAAPFVGTLPISAARYALGLLGLMFFRVPSCHCYTWPPSDSVWALGG